MQDRITYSRSLYNLSMQVRSKEEKFLFLLSWSIIPFILNFASFIYVCTYSNMFICMLQGHFTRGGVPMDAMNGQKALHLNKLLLL